MTLREERSLGEDATVEHALVEDFGLRIGRAMDWPPMAGRAAGVLMLSDTPLTMTQLQEALGASKGSISEITRLLIANGTVARHKEPGSRGFVYQWREEAWVGCLAHQLDQNTELLELARSAQARGVHLPAVQQARLQAMAEYYSFMVERVGELLAEYTRRRVS